MHMDMLLSRKVSLLHSQVETLYALYALHPMKNHLRIRVHMSSSGTEPSLRIGAASVVIGVTPVITFPALWEYFWKSKSQVICVPSEHFTITIILFYYYYCDQCCYCPTETCCLQVNQSHYVLAKEGNTPPAI